MKKKIISFLSLLSVIVTMLPCGYAMAEDTDGLERKASVLQALEIDDVAASGIATNDYIFTSLSGFLYESDYKPSAEDFARNIGAIDFGEIYSGSKSVTKSEALEYAVATLGYKEYADSLGENGFKSVASSLGLTKGMWMSGDDTMSVDECRMMFYNMLEAAPMAAIYSEGKIQHIVERGQTSLSKYRKIHKIYGVLKADEITSIDKVNGCREGFIQIDESLYAIDDYSKDSNLLGKNVEAYVTSDTDYEPKVLYLGEREGKDEVLEINARDVKGISGDFRFLEYYIDSRIKTARIADVPRVIFNGVFYGAYDVPDFKPESGKLRLVDNNNDGRYDVIFISSYETVIVAAADAYDKTIYNKFASDGITLDPDSGDVRYTISDGNGELDFSELKVGDVVSVAKSRATENVVIEVLVSRDAVTGMLQNIDEVELEILISEDVYPLSPAFLNFKRIEGTVNLGGTYTFFLDALGNVAYWKKLSEDGYAVMERAYIDKYNYKTYISYMSLDGIWIDAPIAKRTIINTTSYKDYELAYQNLKNINGQVVKLEYNSDGEIRKIETATQTASYDKDRFTKTPVGQYTWRSGIRGFSDTGTLKCKYYIEDDAKLVVIPQNYKIKSNYEVRDPAGFFRGDTNYHISAYDIDEFGFSKIIVMEYEPQIRNTLFIVTGMSKVAVDGEVCTRLKGHAGDFENMTLTGTLVEDEYGNLVDSLAGVQKGNIIKVSLNGEGYADDYERVFDLSAFTDKTGTQYTSSSYIAGSVSAVDAANGRIQIDVNDDKYTFRIDNSVVVQIYDELGNIERSNIYGVSPRMKVFVDLSWGSVKQMIIKR